MAKSKVAVIGAGVQGVAALKNFREEGFDATCYEKRDSLGGLWQFSSAEDVSSVLKITVANGSKFQSTYTDFPVPTDAPTFMTAQQVVDYMHSYVEHFELGQHIHLNVTLLSIKRNENNETWQLQFKQHDRTWWEDFDKVAVCTGSSQKPFVPRIEGLKDGQIEVFHSANYKGPDAFDGNTVLIVGLGNSTGDIACDLIGHAKKVYVSFRHGNTILPRWVKGKPLDQLANRRMTMIRDIKLAIAPQSTRSSINAQLHELAIDCFNVDPRCKLGSAPSIFTHRAMVSDKFVDHLWQGDIKPLGSLQCFSGTDNVELSDGRVVGGIDCVIYCTGFESDYSLLPPEIDIFNTKQTASAPPARLRLPRLYQHIFPPAYADSFAILNAWNASYAAFPLADLITMAIAQVWKGGYTLPSIDAMGKAIDTHAKWVEDLLAEDKQFPNGNSDAHSKIVNHASWMYWLNDAAGTGVNEKLGYGVEGWWFWLCNMRLCNLLMGGLDSPHVIRLFEGRRRKWEGAEEAIRRCNAELERVVALCREESSKKDR